MGLLVSVNVGKPKDIAWNGRSLRAAKWKTPVADRIKVSRPGVEGDGQADPAGHGGEQRAVLVYQLSSWPTINNHFNIFYKVT